MDTSAIRVGTICTVFSACGLLGGPAAAATPGDNGACQELGPRSLERPSLRRGHEAPDFQLGDINGKKWSLRALRGRPVLLNFWATWCEPCRKEIPAFERLAHRLGERLVVLTVNVDENPDAVKAFFPKGTILPVLLDGHKQAAARYGTDKFPETFLIDSAGRVQYLFYQADWQGPAANACLLSVR